MPGLQKPGSEYPLDTRDVRDTGPDDAAGLPGAAPALLPLRVYVSGHRGRAGAHAGDRGVPGQQRRATTAALSRYRGGRTMSAELIVVMDRRGSMQSIAADMMGGLLTFIAEQRREPGACL